MKNRTIAVLFAASLAGSFALADSPTDAPLMADDARVVAVERDKINDQERARPKAKNESSYREKKSDNAAKNDEKHEPGNADDPSDQGLSTSL